MYYLYFRGIEENIIRNANYLSFKINFSNIKLSDKIFSLERKPDLYFQQKICWIVTVLFMDSLEKIEGLHKKKFDWIPESIYKDLCHFNEFR